MIYIGIDNGVTGSIGIVTDEWSEFHHIPVRNQLNYTKTKKFINRINHFELQRILNGLDHPPEEFYHDVRMVGIERPMVNPGRFTATQSAMRSLESVLIAVEYLEFPYMYLDSKEWQKALLPSGLKKDELKKASLDVGKRLFPQHANKFKKDADGLLIAEYLRRINAVS